MVWRVLEAPFLAPPQAMEEGPLRSLARSRGTCEERWILVTTRLPHPLCCRTLFFQSSLCVLEKRNVVSGRRGKKGYLMDFSGFLSQARCRTWKGFGNWVMLYQPVINHEVGGGRAQVTVGNSTQVQGMLTGRALKRQISVPGACVCVYGGSQSCAPCPQLSLLLKAPA